MEAERKAAFIEKGFGGSSEGVDVEKGNEKGVQKDIGGIEVRDGNGFNDERTVGVGAREGEGEGIGGA